MKQTTRNMIIMVLLLFVAFTTIAWNRGSGIFGGKGKTYKETLTITAAGGRDSTKVLPGYRHMTVSILPGYTASDPDSYSANKDSSVVDIFIRGWANKQRTFCIGSIQLFNPFQLQLAAVWNNPDSGSVAVHLISDLYTTAVGNGTWDSSRIELDKISNLQIRELWPWVDIMIFDNDTKTGKNAAYIINLHGYND